MDQELQLARLRETLKRRKSVLSSCRRNKRKERRFLESVISHCRKEGFNLTQESCHHLCRGKKVKEEECDSFCKIKGFPNVHWHKDVANSSFIAQSEANPPRRKRDLENETLPSQNVQNPQDTDINHKEGNSVIVNQTVNLAECIQKSCVSHSTKITCINLNMEPSTSDLIGSSHWKPLRPSGYSQRTNP